jgi:hypothetical protein
LKPAACADDITLVVGTGLHRRRGPTSTNAFSAAGSSRVYRVVDHVAKDRSTQGAPADDARGVDVWLNREYMRADLRIVTGFVEPHLFAGYSGGGKAVLPAIAGAEAIMANHDARMIGHPKATWCTTEGNPIFEEMRDVALKSEPSFLLNVTLDEQQRVTGVFAGELAAAHDAAIAQAIRHPAPVRYRSGDERRATADRPVSGGEGAVRRARRGPAARSCSPPSAARPPEYVSVAQRTLARRAAARSSTRHVTTFDHGGAGAAWCRPAAMQHLRCRERRAAHRARPDGGQRSPLIANGARRSATSHHASSPGSSVRASHPRRASAHGQQGEARWTNHDSMKYCALAGHSCRTAHQ